MRFSNSSKVHNSSDSTSDKLEVVGKYQRSTNLVQEIFRLFTKCLVNQESKIEEQACGITPTSSIASPHAIHKVKKWLDENNTSKYSLSDETLAKQSTDSDVSTAIEADGTDSRKSTQANQSKMIRKYVASQKEKSTSHFRLKPKTSGVQRIRTAMR